MGGDTESDSANDKPTSTSTTGQEATSQKPVEASLKSTPTPGKTLSPSDAAEWSTSFWKNVVGVSGYSGFSRLTASPPFSQDPEVQRLRKEILDLEIAVSKQASQLETEKADKGQLKKTLIELRKKQELDFPLKSSYSKCGKGNADK